MRTLLLSLTAAAGLFMFGQAEAATTYSGKLLPYGIAGPFTGTLDTCTLDAKDTVDLAESYPGTVIVRNNAVGRAKFTLECE